MIRQPIPALGIFVRRRSPADRRPTHANIALVIFFVLFATAGAAAQGEVPVIFESNILNASNGSGDNAFGAGLATGGGRLFIGAPRDSTGGSLGGSVYVFERDGQGQWLEVQKLIPSGNQVFGVFGLGIAVYRDRLAVAALGEDDHAGAVYVFERTDGIWLETARLTAPQRVAGEDFGSAVALEGTRLVVGARDTDSSTGAAYVFARQTDGSWFRTARLLGSDSAQFDNFGSAVAVLADEIVVGALHDDDLGNSSGAAFVFGRRADGRWVQTQKLLGSAQDQTFGNDIALSSHTLLIGSQGGPGAAFAFQREGELWVHGTRMRATNVAFESNFGQSVTLAGNLALIGAPEEKIGEIRVGAAYLFQRTGPGVWEPLAKLQASNAENSDGVGEATGLLGTEAFLGMSSNQFDPGIGSTWIFRPTGLASGRFAGVSPERDPAVLVRHAPGRARSLSISKSR